MMYRFECKDTFWNLPFKASKNVLLQNCNCSFVAEHSNKDDLIRIIADHATEEHCLLDRRLAPPMLMNKVLDHIKET